MSYEIIQIFAQNYFIITLKFTFKKEEKLKGTRLIQQLFEEGKTFSVFPFKVLYKFTLFEDACLKAGFGISQKKFKKATDRNRLKRLMRECYRVQKQYLKDILTFNKRSLAVFFIYTGNTLPEYTELKEKIKASLKRLEKIANENDITNS